MAMALTVLFQMCVAHSLPSSSSLEDEILKLPGQPQVGFRQFSGYVEVDENNEKALFYYFVESHSDPASKPLVLWLNGGYKSLSLS